MPGTPVTFVRFRRYPVVTVTRYLPRPHLPGLSRPRLALLLGGVLVVGLVPGAFADSKPSDVRRQLAAVTQEVEHAEHEQEALLERIRRLEASVKRTQQQTAAVRARLSERARATYTNGMGSDEVVLSIMTSGRPTDTVERISLLGAVSAGDDEVLERARSATRRLRIQREQLDIARAEAAATEKRLVKRSAELNALLAKLAAAQRSERSVRASRDGSSRDIGAARGVVTAGRACLVGPAHSFSDTYGHPRGGGRAHEGVDVFAPYGSGVYAVESGTIKRAYTSSRGGKTIVLTGNSGTEYWYMHQSANSVSSGQSVAVGERIGSVGTSGNAQGRSAHVHFEVHPGGGGPINPTPFVRATC